MEKQYGQSVLNYLKNDDTVADPELEFVDLMSDSEVESEREVLKQGERKRRDIVTTDAINGIKSASKDEYDPETLEAIVNERDIRGKTLTQGAISLIKDLLKDDPTEEELKHISNFFDKLNSESKKLNELSTDELDAGLGERIVTRLHKFVDDRRYHDVLSRFAEQLMASYIHEIEYNDDLRELTKISKLLKKRKDEMGLMSDSDIDTEFITNTSEDFVKILDRLKNLSDRDSRMKANYTVDDIETEILDNVKECLQDSLSFKLVKEKHNNNRKKYYKDMKNIDEVYNDIENWLSNIKNDPETIYTLPINGYLNISESREAFIKYLYETYLMLRYGVDKLSDDTVMNIEEDYIKNGVCTQKELKHIKTTIIYFIYLLTKAFKYKKINTPDKRRVLSYTLDILSKMGKSEYQKIFMEIISYIDE